MLLDQFTHYIEVSFRFGFAHCRLTFYIYPPEDWHMSVYFIIFMLRLVLCRPKERLSKCMCSQRNHVCTLLQSVHRLLETVLDMKSLNRFQILAEAVYAMNLPVHFLGYISTSYI